MAEQPFHFKKYSIVQEGAAHKVGTDGVLLGAWTDPTAARNILDIGTGTGLIALMLAQHAAEDCFITGIDLHGPSVACARSNFERSPWAGRLCALQARLQEFTHAGTFDLIVSNPPFFSAISQSPDPARAQARSNADALPLQDLVDGVMRLLAPGGRFCVVLPEREGRELCEMATVSGLYCSRETCVLSKPGRGVERLLLCLEHNAGRYRKETLVIRNESGEYDPAYLSLVRPYYPWCP